MTGDEYLRGILGKYAVNAVGAKAAGRGIYPVLQKWSNGYMVSADFSGSLAKGTGISIGTDADIFISVASNTPSTLAEMYGTLYTAVSSAGYPARKQDVSIGTKINGYTIDLVPGKRQSQYGDDHSLYRNKAQTWTQTNIAKHIDYVRQSNRIDEIRILKTWRQLHGLEFPSFYLEMAVIDALRYARVGSLSANVLSALDHFRDKIESVRYIDPANSNNIVSDDCSVAEKRAIARQAASSQAERAWESIVW